MNPAACCYQAGSFRNLRKNSICRESRMSDQVKNIYGFWAQKRILSHIGIQGDQEKCRDTLHLKGTVQDIRTI